MKSLHVDTFKRHFGITQRELNQLARNGKVRIAQSGYLGHSLVHPRLVVFNEDFTVRKSAKPKILEISDPPQLGYVFYLHGEQRKEREQDKKQTYRLLKSRKGLDKVLLKAWKTSQTSQTRKQK